MSRADPFIVTKTTWKTIVYHYDKDGRTLSETDNNGNLIADYVYLNGKLVAKAEPNNVLYFYHTDPAGTALAMTNTSGVVKWQTDYKPFGEEQSISPNTIENNEKFVGKEKDKETGLYYFGARYLGPKTGRFVTVDPVGISEKNLLNPQKLNRYVYSLNNPYRYVDPNGKWPEEVHNTIISRAFGKGKNSLAMQRGSIEADTPKYQDNAHSYMHAMRAPGQSAEEAAGLTVNYIMGKVAEYKNLMSQNKTNEAYEALGMAMHPLMDNTSPSHSDYKEWSGVLPVIPNTFKAVSHGRAEDKETFNSNPDFSTRTVDTLRKFYDQVNK